MRKRFLYVLGICMFVLCIGRSIVLPVKRSKTAQNKPLPAHVRGSEYVCSLEEIMGHDHPM